MLVMVSYEEWVDHFCATWHHSSVIENQQKFNDQMQEPSIAKVKYKSCILHLQCY